MVEIARAVVSQTCPCIDRDPGNQVTENAKGFTNHQG
jgi:hypothetical protein